MLFAVPKSERRKLRRHEEVADWTHRGRLHEIALAILAGSDIQFGRKHRQDIAPVKNHPIALVFLPAADISTFVGEGRFDLGITGKDQVCEHEALTPPTEDIGAEEKLDLQYGYCKLQDHPGPFGSCQLLIIMLLLP